jgi:ribokinase
VNFQPPTDDDVTCLTGSSGSKPDILITHLTLDTSTVERILETAWKNGVETILSASPTVYLVSETYRHITHIVFNEHEAAEMSDHSVKDFEDLEVAKQAARSFVQRGVKYVIITLGEAGSVYATEVKTGYVPAEKNVRVRDTTGAG